MYTSDFQPYASNISTQGARNFNSSQKIRNLDIQNNFYETVT